jgi:Lrp/AsnC family transcriptional regulator, leucine-responsive regulatory protein
MTSSSGLDRRILAELQREARVTMAELGRRVGLSAPAVADRVARLERDGLITGYHAAVDPHGVGLGLTTVIRVRPAPGQLVSPRPRARRSRSSSAAA